VLPKGPDRTDCTIDCRRATAELDKSRQRVVDKMMKEFPDVITEKIGCYTPHPFEIKIIPGAKPPHKPPYRTSEYKKRIIEQKIKKMLELDIIE